MSSARFSAMAGPWGMSAREIASSMQTGPACWPSWRSRWRMAASTLIVTDDSWKHHYGPLLENDLLMGESDDARLEMPGWDSPGFDDSGWRSVVVFEDTGQPWWRPTARRSSGSKN